MLCYSALQVKELSGINLNMINLSPALAKDVISLKDLLHFTSIFIRGISLAITNGSISQVPLLSISYEPESTISLWIVEPILNTLHIGKSFSGLLKKI